MAAIDVAALQRAAPRLGLPLPSTVHLCRDERVRLGREPPFVDGGAERKQLGSRIGFAQERDAGANGNVAEQRARGEHVTAELELVGIETVFGTQRALVVDDGGATAAFVD